MDAIISFFAEFGWQHWAILGLMLLIAEMASGTTYLLWPAVAAFVTSLIAAVAGTNWVAEIAIFAVLCFALTAFGRPIVQRWRNEHAATNLNERSSSLIGVRGVVSTFANGVGSVKVGDTMWRAMSDDALETGQPVVVEGVDGTTLKVKRA